MTVNEMMLLHKYLLEVKKDKEAFIRFVSKQDIEDPLQRMYPHANVRSERLKIKEKREQELAEVNHLIDTILKETMTARVLATDTKTFLKL